MGAHERKNLLHRKKKKKKQSEKGTYGKGENRCKLTIWYGVIIPQIYKGWLQFNSKQKSLKIGRGLAQIFLKKKKKNTHTHKWLAKYMMANIFNYQGIVIQNHNEASPNIC